MIRVYNFYMLSLKKIKYKLILEIKITNYYLIKLEINL